MKECTRCLVVKPYDSYHKSKGAKGGLHTICKVCRKAVTAAWNAANSKRHYVKHMDKKRAYYAANKEKLKQAYKTKKELYPMQHYAYTLEKNYGLSLEAYEKMFLDQNYCCAICGTPHSQSRLCVDHCHKTGKVRALLCGQCNKGLGHFKDDADTMESGIRYLLKHSRKE